MVEELHGILFLDRTDAPIADENPHDPSQTGDLMSTSALALPWTAGPQNSSGDEFDWGQQSQEMARGPPRTPSVILLDESSHETSWSSIFKSDVMTRSGSPALPTTYQSNTPLSTEIFDLQGKLIDAYFNTVCRIFSTFDSPQNLFRSYINRRWQNSSAMFYAMLSMSSAKLGRQSLTYKKYAYEYQSLAIKQLGEDVSVASFWTPELLFIVLMLGLSTSWHDISDLGLVHLEAMQHAVFNTQIICADDELDTLDFFQKALVYWEMVTSWVSEDVTIHDYTRLSPCRQRQIAPRESNPFNVERLKPHPWTSISQQPQALFTRLVRLFRQLKSFDHGSKTPKSHLAEPATFLQAVEALEVELWSLELPSLHEIANTGDANTPPIHHLLLAEAYMFANFYQLYQVFPNLLSKRGRHLNQPHSSRSMMQNLTMLTSLSDSDTNSEDWLKFLGRNIITRLDQIHMSSGTSCVQPLLLLVGSTSLSIDPDSNGGEEEVEILRMRKSVLARLSFISDACLSEPIHSVEMAVKEIFKRLDIGVNVFWMDMLQNMGLVTIIG
ncbi:hypothetical protein Daus18300_013745 [Diaporthe australafricana]|uniref:Transcription factor domain-containing protein n=1 Tax=Diaporthe australafricana TaxID=127596 RepID=A0ABR3VY56_9PEZI